eukprot:228563-Rhodomonas_salina.2
MGGAEVARFRRFYLKIMCRGGFRDSGWPPPTTVVPVRGKSTQKPTERGSGVDPPKLRPTARRNLRPEIPGGEKGSASGESLGVADLCVQDTYRHVRNRLLRRSVVNRNNRGRGSGPMEFSRSFIPKRGIGILEPKGDSLPFLSVGTTSRIS